jgi:hypothetical protein
MKRFIFALALLFSNLVLAEEAPPLPYTFDLPRFGYSIRYPVGWDIEHPADFTTVFGGKFGTEAFHSTVSIQNVAPPKSGNPLESGSEVFKDMLRQLEKEAADSSVQAVKSFILARGENSLAGYQLVADYTKKGELFRQWLVVLPRRDGSVVYVWSYTAPGEDFATYLPIAKAMLDSWRFHPDLVKK